MTRTNPIERVPAHFSTAAAQRALPEPLRGAAALRRSVVVGLSFGPASALALTRGLELARLLRMDLIAVHVLPLPHRFATRRQVPSLDERRRRTMAAKLEAQRWARSELGIGLPGRLVRVRFGEPAAALAAATRKLGACLLVIGGHSGARSPAEASPTPHHISHRIVAESPCAVFLASEQRGGAAWLVATDLGSPGLPVLQAATALAAQLGRRITLVHNVDSIRIGGVKYPLPRRIRDRVMGDRLERLGDVVRTSVHVDDARIMNEADAARAVLRAARSDDADLIVVGRYPHLGATTTRVLDDAKRSVLVVPVQAPAPTL